jgi:hypothetical protein
MLGGKVGEVRKSIYHLKRGELYTIGGKSFFCFGGGLSIDKYHRTLGVSYWEEEIPNVKEMDYGLQTLQKANYKVDYIITHTLPKSLFHMFGFSLNEKYEDPTSKYLDHIANSVEFYDWFFGHMHIDKRLGKFAALYDNIERVI